jgi:hypothetical protein
MKRSPRSPTNNVKKEQVHRVVIEFYEDRSLSIQSTSEKGMTYFSELMVKTAWKMMDRMVERAKRLKKRRAKR